MEQAAFMRARVARWFCIASRDSMVTNAAESRTVRVSMARMMSVSTRLKPWRFFTGVACGVSTYL